MASAVSTPRINFDIQFIIGSPRRAPALGVLISAPEYTRERLDARRIEISPLATTVSPSGPAARLCPPVPLRA
jgi:hypothetical protein